MSPLSRCPHLSIVLLSCAALVGACAALKRSEEATPLAPDAGGASDADADRTAARDPASEGSASPRASCRPTPLPCLDPTDPQVLDVPSEDTLVEALESAHAGATIQVRGKAVGDLRVPPHVTLRGCEGAALAGIVGFAGSAGVIEGFEVRGDIVARVTGTYVVRGNRFVASTSTNPAITASSVDALVGATVTILVEANRFEGRPEGVVASTRYDTLTHAVDATLQNNVFFRVGRPLYASEGGLVGVIKVRALHNTFYDFETAIALFDVSQMAVTTGNLFAKGETAIDGVLYESPYSLAWLVDTPQRRPAADGSTMAIGDPLLRDAEAGDLMLRPGSPAVDVIPSGASSPNEDHDGCPRPAGGAEDSSKGDIGAFEAPPIKRS